MVNPSVFVDRICEELLGKPKLEIKTRSEILDDMIRNTVVDIHKDLVNINGRLTEIARHHHRVANAIIKFPRTRNRSATILKEASELMGEIGALLTQLLAIQRQRKDGYVHPLTLTIIKKYEEFIPKCMEWIMDNAE